MPVTIPDDVLKQAGLSEREALIEIACRLFEGAKLDLWPAARLAGLSRMEFVAELRKRAIYVFRPTVADLEADLQALERLGP